MKINKNPLTVAVAALALVLAVLPVGATTISECQSLIAIVKGDLASVEIGGGNPDRTRAGLESKLDGASTKLDQAKFADAIAKLVDFQSQVAQLAGGGKPKIDQAAADLLTAGAGDAITCVCDLIPDDAPDKPDVCFQ